MTSINAPDVDGCGMGLRGRDMVARGISARLVLGLLEPVEARRRSLTFVLVVCLAAASLLPATRADAAINPKQVTSNSWTDMNPCLSGTRAVWLGDPTSGVFQVYYDDVSDIQAPVALTSGSLGRQLPAISGKRAVWSGQTAAGSDTEIYYDADVTDGIAAVTLTNNSSADVDAAIWGTRVVWTGTVAGQNEIWYDDVSDPSAPVTLTATAEPETMPSISGSRVVWLKHDGTDYDVYYDDISDSDPPVALTSDKHVDYNPSIKGSMVVWNGNPLDTGTYEGFEIFYDDVADALPARQLTNNLYDDGSVTVSGSRIVWHANASGQYDIWYDDVSDPTPPVALSTMAGDELDPWISDTRFVWKRFDGSEYEIMSEDLSADLGLPKDNAPFASNVIVVGNEDTLIPVTFNGVDADADPLQYFRVSQPAHGTLTGFGSTVYYQPAPNYFGPDSFVYQAMDGELQSQNATVTISVAPVNDAPVATTIGLAPLTEDTPRTIALIGSDSDGVVSTYSIVTPPAHGTLAQLVGMNWRLTPSLNYNGPDSFTFKVRDNGGLDSNVATVTFTVIAVNDAPAAADDSATTDADIAVSIPVLANDTDVEGSALTVSTVSDPPNGSAVASGSAVVYTPDAGWSGTDAFTYTAGDGGASSNAATVTVTVNPGLQPHAAVVPIPTAGISLGFASLTQTNTSSATASSGWPAPTGFVLVPGTCFDISTTAAFSGDVLVTLPYDPAQIGGASESSLRLFHWKNGAWEDITVSVDTANNTVTGRTTSFSEFAIMGPSGPAAVSTPADSPWSIALLGVAGVLTLAFVRRQRLAL